MQRQRFSAFIIAHNAKSQIRKISIPRASLYVIGLFCLIGIVTTASAVYHYASMAVKLMAFHDLQEENRAIKVENQKYRVLSSQLAEKISSLEVASKKVSLLSGLEPADPKSGIGGVGGYARATTSVGTSSTSIADLQSYQAGLTRLEDRYRDLQNYYESKAIRTAFTPNIWPVKGYLTGGFGYRSDPFNENDQAEYHYGVDISASYGKTVVAPADGVVIHAGPRRSLGNAVVIDHKFGTTTRFGHLSRISVRVGQRVSRGEVIGQVGSTGRSTASHLHYEVRLHNRAVNPTQFLKSYPKIS